MTESKSTRPAEPRIRVQRNSGVHFTAWILWFAVGFTLIGTGGCEVKKVDSSQPADNPNRLSVNCIAVIRVDKTVETSIYVGTLEPKQKQTLGFGVGGTLDSIGSVGQKFSANTVITSLKVDELESQRLELERQLSEEPTTEPNDPRNAQLQGLVSEIQRRQLVAPFDCVVVKRFVEGGSLVRAQSPVIEIFAQAKPRIRIELPSRVERLLTVGQELSFVTGGETILGAVTQKAVNENSVGSTEVWFDVTSEFENEFRFGQLVEAQLNFEQERSGFWLPLTALSRSGSGLWSVLSVGQYDAETKEAAVTQKLVSVVQLEDDYVLIDGELSESELVIANGIHRVVPGQTVTPVLLNERGEQ